MDAAALEAAHEINLKFYWTASIVILYYEYFATLDVEVASLWGRRPTIAHCLFYLNRYVPLVSYTVVLAFIFNRSIPTSVCHSFLNFPPVAIYLSEIVMGLIVILRTRALYAGSRPVVAVMLVVFTAQLVFGGVVTMAATKSVKWFGILGCITPFPANFTSVLWFLWPTACIFDGLVLYLTVHRTVQMRKQGQNIALVSMIHRDGVTYFAIMFTAKLVNLIVFLAASPDLMNVNWPFNNIICVVMINRLVLNIRQEVARNSDRGELAEKVIALNDDRDSVRKGSFEVNEDSRIGALSTIHGGFFSPGSQRSELESAWADLESKGDVDTYVEPFHFDSLRSARRP